MKKYLKKLLYVILILVIPFGIFNVTGCGFFGNKDSENLAEYDKFLKDYAVEVNKTENKQFEGFTANTSYDFAGCVMDDETYFYNGRGFVNILSGKVFQANDLYRIEYNLELYGDDLNNVYDIEGNKLPIAAEYVDYYTKKNLVIAKDSEFYTFLTGEKSDEKELILMYCIEYDMYCGFMMAGDNALLASNVYLKKDCSKGLNNLFAGEVLEDESLEGIVIVSEYGKKILSLTYGENPILNNVIITDLSQKDPEGETEPNPDPEEKPNPEEKPDYGDANMLFGLTNKSGSKTAIFTYYVDTVDEITNDYNLVLGDRHCKVTTVFNDKVDSKNVNFFPIEKLLSKNGDYAYILCNKIEENKELSNDYYVAKVTLKGIERKLSRNVSLFGELDFHYIMIDKHYYKIENKEILLVTKEYGIAYEEERDYHGNVIENYFYFKMPKSRKGTIELYPLPIVKDYRLINSSEPWNNKLWFCNGETIRSLEYNGEDAQTFNFTDYKNYSFISERHCMFKVDGEVYYMGVDQNINLYSGAYNRVFSFTTMGKVNNYFAYEDVKTEKLVVRTMR